MTATGSSRSASIQTDRAQFIDGPTGTNKTTVSPTTIDQLQKAIDDAVRTRPPWLTGFLGCLGALGVDLTARLMAYGLT